MGKEAHGRGAWHGEVDKLRALEAYEAVSTGDDEHHRDCTDERPQPGTHADSVSHSSFRNLAVMLSNSCQAACTQDAERFKLTEAYQGASVSAERTASP